MLATVVTFLIYLCIFVLVIYLALWVIRDVLGIPIPEKVVQILWVIVALVVILWLVQTVMGGGGGALRFPSLR
jgi:hypothetical protein